MSKLWKSLIQPNLDYCSQLWSPVDQPGPLGALEEPLKAFSRKVYGCQHLNYWQRLSFLNISSIQRRFERYKIIYIWKSISGLVPSLGLTLAFTSTRGRMIEIPMVRGTCKTYIGLMERSLKYEGSKLFNSMPIYIRNLSGSKEQFKYNLDKLLSCIPDQPATRDMVPHALTEDCAPTNSIKYWTKTLCLQGWIPPTNQKQSLLHAHDRLADGPLPPYQDDPT